MELIIEKKLKEWLKEALEKKSESWLKKILPFDSNRIKDTCCFGLTYNRGLLTQCEKKKKEDSLYCRGCSESSIGTVEERKNAGLYSYRDRKGHKPQHYIDVLKKMNITVEEVVREASRLGIKINEEHLKEKVTQRGRPKKVEEKKEEREDLFACVYLNDVDEYLDDVEIVETIEVKEVIKSKRLSVEEKRKMNENYERRVEEMMKLCL